MLASSKVIPAKAYLDSSVLVGCSQMYFLYSQHVEEIGLFHGNVGQIFV